MKRKFTSLILALSLTACLFSGCGKGNDSDASNTNLNKEEQVSSKVFTTTMEAFKDFYDTFYDEHRFNGNFNEPEDCFANIYLDGETPIMVIMDVINVEERTVINDNGGRRTFEVATADLFIFEYKGGEVSVRAKYPSVQFGNDEAYIYPLQGKLFMHYADYNREYRVAELGEYLTNLETETLFVEERGSEEYNYEEILQKEIVRGVRCDSIEDFFAEDYDHELKTLNYFKTNLSSDNYAGHYLLREEGIEGICLNSIYNYALIADSGLKRDGVTGHGFYSTEFKKYLDYLIKQEITNNIQLLICHAEYLESIGVFDYDMNEDYVEETAEGIRIDVVVWLDGIYYLMYENIAYPIAYDYGYSKEDLPKKVCGYNVKDDIVKVLSVISSGDADAYYDSLEKRYPLAVVNRTSVEDLREKIVSAKVNYEKTVGPFLDAYEENIKDYTSRLDAELKAACKYQLFYLDDDNIPEIALLENGCAIVFTYHNEKVEQILFNYNIFWYVEKQGLIHGIIYNQGVSGDVVYKLQNEEFEELFLGNIYTDQNFDSKYYIKTGNSNIEINKEKYYEPIREIMGTNPIRVSHDDAFDSLNDAIAAMNLIN